MHRKILLILMLVLCMICTTLTGCAKTYKAGDVIARTNPVKPVYREKNESTVIVGDISDIDDTDETVFEADNTDDKWYEEVSLVSDDEHFVYQDPNTGNYKVFKIYDDKIVGLTEYIICGDEDAAEQIYEFYDKIDPYKFKDASVREHYIKEYFIVIEYKYIAWTGVTVKNVEDLYGKYKVTEEPEIIKEKREEKEKNQVQKTKEVETETEEATY